MSPVFNNEGRVAMKVTIVGAYWALPANYGDATPQGIADSDAESLSEGELSVDEFLSICGDVEFTVEVDEEATISESGESIVKPPASKNL